MNKFGLLIGIMLMAATPKMHAQMDRSIKLNEVMTNNVVIEHWFKSFSLFDEFNDWCAF